MPQSFPLHYAVQLTFFSMGCMRLWRVCPGMLCSAYKRWDTQQNATLQVVHASEILGQVM